MDAAAKRRDIVIMILSVGKTGGVEFIRHPGCGA
jgi:hypothetical protein